MQCDGSGRIGGISLQGIKTLIKNNDMQWGQGGMSSGGTRIYLRFWFDDLELHYIYFVATHIYGWNKFILDDVSHF